jgi:predicted RNase H-like HicB family nuclease
MRLLRRLSNDARKHVNHSGRCNEHAGDIVPLTIEVEQEVDGRWLAEIPDLPGVMTYGQTRREAIERVQVLSLRVLADRLDHGEPVPRMSGVFAVTP